MAGILTMRLKVNQADRQKQKGQPNQMHYHGNMMILIPLSTSLKKCGNDEKNVKVLGAQNHSAFTSDAPSSCCP